MLIRVNTISLKLEELARALAVLRLVSPERRCGISLACTRPGRCEIQIDLTDPYVELGRHDRIWAKLQWTCTVDGRPEGVDSWACPWNPLILEPLICRRPKRCSIS